MTHRPHNDTRWPRYIRLGLSLVLLGLFAAPLQAASVAQLLADSQAAATAGDLLTAETLAREAIAAGTAADQSALVADSQRALGRVLISLNRYDEAQTVLEQSLLTLEPLGPSESLASTLSAIAVLHRYRADYPTALTWLRQAHQLFVDLDDERGLQSTYTTYGVIYDLMGQQDEALEWHSRSLALARELDYGPGIADGVYAIGEVHRALGEHDAALAYYQESLQLDEASGAKGNIAYSHIKLGATLKALGRLDEAHVHYTAALDLFEQMNTPRDYQWARAHLADLDALEGKVQSSRQTLEDVLSRSVTADWPRLVNHTREWLVQLECRAGRTDEALQHLERVLADVLAQQSLRRALRLYDMKARCLEEADRAVEALAALRERDALESNLFDSFRTSIIAAMQGEAEFERALELAQKDKTLAELALERESTYRAMGFAALVTFFILAFLIYGRIVTRRQNRRLSQEVSEKTGSLIERNAELEQAYRAVERASVVDPLTGLYNRRFLEGHIEADAARSQRLYREWDGDPDKRPIAADLVFFMIDLDHFKSINDSRGHTAGDAVLVQVSRILEAEFREADFVVRWGGEEFLTVARFVDRFSAPAVAQRICAAVENQAFQLEDGSTLSCTCSIGFAAYPLAHPGDDDATWQDVSELADQALYGVKSGPRNGWQGYIGLRSLRPERPLARWISAAVDAGTLRLVRSFDNSD